MIKRELTGEVQRLAKLFPAIAITGPRQSGKTTLAQLAFPGHTYISFEDPDVKNDMLADPRAFLNRFASSAGVIFDEVQQVPELFSYLQGYIDRDKKPGFYILTGSHNFLLLQAITQTLAGRIALFTLLPLSMTELADTGLLPSDPLQAMVSGWYPPICTRQFAPVDWYPSYIKTYLERDVRLVRNVGDLSQFQMFLKMCAGRIGQILNMSSLANDCGLSVSTVKSWLSILEASYIVFFLHPHHKNFSKRLIKSPKMYFYDTGIACWLLGIKDAQTLDAHYLRGGLFESMIISELIKQHTNRGITPWCYFWRDQTGHEVDCLVERGPDLFPVEIKAGLTINNNFFDGLTFFNELAGVRPADSFVIYSGTQAASRHEINIVGWQSCNRVVEHVYPEHKLVNEH